MVVLIFSELTNNHGHYTYGNIERIKAVSKNWNTFDDVVTLLLDIYEELQSQDWINTRAGEKQEDEQLSG